MSGMLGLLAEAGYYAVAADYRGAGDSSVAATGYDKMTMAQDLHSLMVDVMKCEKYSILGHDIGAMVAVAQALQFRTHIETLIFMECPLPGTAAYEHCLADRAIAFNHIFHFFFHQPLDLPELLTAGREKQYLEHFYDRLAHVPDCPSRECRDAYASAFSRAGRMRAGFELYRAFTRDGEDLRENVKAHGKIDIPVLATGGEHSLFTGLSGDIASEFAKSYEHVSVSNSNHWVMGENAEELAEVVIGFLRKHVAN